VKSLAIFLAGLLVAFGLLAAAIVLSRDSARAFVVVDSSFPMRAVWSQVPGALSDIRDQGYAAYALASEKELIHPWQSDLRFREVRVYAPCDLSEIESYEQAPEADARILITTPGACATDGLTGWDVVLLEP
jgi:hypothetical protein